MEKRQIQYQGVWYSLGDNITIEEKEPFLFLWTKNVQRNYQVQFIGSDCAASISDGERTKTIIGNVNIFEE
jgi:hypothetical protein